MTDRDPTAQRGPEGAPAPRPGWGDAAWKAALVTGAWVASFGVYAARTRPAGLAELLRPPWLAVAALLYALFLVGIRDDERKRAAAAAAGAPRPAWLRWWLLALVLAPALMFT